MGAQSGIQHVVVLMLENRSFDSMFGKLYPKSAGFDGLSGTESNPYHKPDGSVETATVWNNSGMDPVTASIPDPDPGELFPGDMNLQLFGLGGTANDDSPPMTGFVDDYMRQPDAGRSDPRAVMHYFTPEQLPVLSTLARTFGVSDQWHASAPCQTWPNRFFLHTGTANGYVNNMPTHFPYTMPTVFRRLQGKRKSWRVYYHDTPHALTLADLWLEAPFRFRGFDADFENDAKAGDLPNYSFIEPRYFTSLDQRLIPNDQHPPHNVVYGEQLIARVYNAIRNAPTWKQTLLIVTYDEHGGCYDHVSPPLAVPPDAKTSEFAFDRYGVRVPAVIVSPYIAPGSIVRAAPGGLPHRGPPYPYDHTSVIATLRNLFDLGAPFTARDASAPDLIGALSLSEPENDGPANIPVPTPQPSIREVEKVAAARPNNMQQSLCSMALQLPTAAAHTGAQLAALKSQPPAPVHTVFERHGDAAEFAIARTDLFLKRQG
ncbi:MAG: phospholipase [Rhodospirillaceae bacterium]|nr:phospholipase [Rhodospirillaceae bacterium]